MQELTIFLNLPDYKGTPIIRVKDPNNEQKECLYHAFSQILNYQLNLNFYQKAQEQKIMVRMKFQKQPKLNNQFKNRNFRIRVILGNLLLIS